jgi:hypothetical protein
MGIKRNPLEDKTSHSMHMLPFPPACPCELQHGCHLQLPSWRAPAMVFVSKPSAACKLCSAKRCFLEMYRMNIRDK